MTGWLRRAGRGVDASGATVIWSVSEGRRGRRWREARIGKDGGLVSSLLLETDPGGRFLHTELSTGAGLLTLHPEAHSTLHGNVIAIDGVRHVVGLPWSADRVLGIEGSIVAAAAAAHLLGPAVGAGESVTRAGVVVDLGLEVVASDHAVRRAGDGTWQLGHAGSMRLTADGLPTLEDAEDWPLEVG